MLSRTLGFTALAATTAHGILVPPSIAADFGDDNAMEVSVNPLKRTVAVECPTCAFASRNGDELVWQQDAGSSFLLDFEVGSRESTLDIDGVQLYPPTFGYFTAPFLITQVDPASEEDLKLRVTGYTFHYNAAETMTEAGIELLPMTFHITSIEDRAVDPPAVTINLLKDTKGRLMIASFQMAKADAPTAEEEECKQWPLLCRARALIHDKINRIKSAIRKGCHMMRRPHPEPVEPTEPVEPVEAVEDVEPIEPVAPVVDAVEAVHPVETIESTPPPMRPGHKHHGSHHMSGHHHHHHHNHRHHRLHMFLRRAFFTILIPVLVGIFAGTLTYLVGMALGTLIAFIVSKVRGRNPYERIALDEEQDIEVGKEAEKQDDAAPPTYDAPPVYEEVSEKEVIVEEE